MKIQAISVLARSYSTILFLDSPIVGSIILGVTFLNPNIGFCGLLGAIVGLIVSHVFSFPNEKNGVYIFNSLLVGLSLGAFYQINAYVVVLIVLGAIFTVFLTVALQDGLWRLDRLPVLSLPFIVVSGLTALVAQKYSTLNNFIDYVDASAGMFILPVDNFFISLGSTFFTPHPLAGLLLFLCIVWTSRYLALLAVIGYVFGQFIFTLLTDNPPPSLLAWTGFNFMLTAIAIGGIFVIPGYVATLTVLLAVSFTALLIVSMQGLLFVYGLPVLALPFVMTVLIFLIAFRKRVGLSQPWLAPEPGLPEVNYEKARLARVRNGEVNSVALLVPFMGQWNIYQGFNGAHTHQAPWQHALDFYITEDGRSFKNEASQLKDFYCFGLPVLSPAHGQVIRTFDKLPDNTPGEVDVNNNWGNFILIHLDTGLYVLLAHLSQNSIVVKEGDRVTPGKLIAACGNSGRSPQPHLHLQVQRDPELGSPTHPFHLASVMRHHPDSASEYMVVCRPDEGDRIESAADDELLATQLHLPVGRQLSFLLEGSGIEKPVRRDLQVEITLLGQFRLTSDTEASAAFEENNGVLAFYDRKGPADILLDIFLLANGLTPLTESAHQWRDSPSAKLFPLGFSQKLLLAIFKPLGCGIDSLYQRSWDAENRIWAQSGQHQLGIGANLWRAETESVLDPEKGFREITLRFNNNRWHAKLVEIGLASDRGIPGWNEQDGDVSAPVVKGKNEGAR